MKSFDFCFAFSAVLHSYANSNVEMLIKKTEKSKSLTFRTNINSLNESRRISKFDHGIFIHILLQIGSVLKSIEILFKSWKFRNLAQRKLTKQLEFLCVLIYIKFYIKNLIISYRFCEIIFY